MSHSDSPAPTRNVDPQRLLYSLMLPSIIMPLSGWMFSVSLPIIRDDFGLASDVAAWIATAFSLPFMILMPVYGRISDGLGKRRLLLIGISIFTAGTTLATLSADLPTLLVARSIQGFGVAGLLPLSLALISEAFPPDRRGGAMGTFSTIGPITGVIGPILAGFIVATWGWRSAFIPGGLFALIGLVIIYRFIPSTNRAIDFGFLRSFDWLGVGLLSATLTFLLFYLSSRPITGVAPLRDWRLLGAMLFFLVTFVWHERRHTNPFIRLDILSSNRSLVIGSVCHSLRMMCLSGGMGFLMPLYLADVVDLDPSRTGFFLMANPLAMALIVRFAGKSSDRWGSRLFGMVGFSILAFVMTMLSRFSAETPHWQLIAILFTFGIGAGLMLAAFHRAALNNVPEADLGTASGLYSMIRFLGSAFGAAVGGILLQHYRGVFSADISAAYQSVFLWFIGIALLGALLSTQLPKQSQ